MVECATPVKVCVLGDYGVGKISFLVTWYSNAFPDPKSLYFDRGRIHRVLVDGKDVEVSLDDPTS